MAAIDQKLETEAASIAINLAVTSHKRLNGGIIIIIIIIMVGLLYGCQP